MNPGSFGRRRVDRDPEVAGQPLQLALQVLPLADPQEVQVLGPAEPAEGRGGQLPLPLRQVVPQVQVGDEIRVGIGEAAVLVVGLLLRVGGALARILDGQCGRDDQDLAGASVLVGLQDHPADARVHRQPGQLAPQRSDPACCERVQLGQQGQPVGDIAGIGRIDEREPGHLAAARVVRRIAGSVNSGRDSKSSSAYSRMQIPSEVRPQRPLRWLAEACEIGSMGSRCTLVRWLYLEMRAVPGSMTYLMPGTVSEVSATLVASTTRRVKLEAARRWNTLCCSAADSREYSGSTSRRSRPDSRSAVSRISRSPLRNTRMSPGPSADSSSTASLIAWP